MEIKDGVLIVSTHDLKTNLSKYLRLMLRGQVRGIIVRRYRRRLAVILPYTDPKSAPAPESGPSPPTLMSTDMAAPPPPPA